MTVPPINKQDQTPNDATSEGVSRERLEKEAHKYIHLGKLIKKVRSASAQEAVEKIVESALSIEEKISKIEELDGEAESAKDKQKSYPGLRRTRGAASAEERFYRSASRVKRGVVDSVRNRHKLAVEPRPRGFLDFFFIERQRIAEFARASHLIEPGFLGLFPKIHREEAAKLADTLQKDILPRIKPKVDGILAKEWRQLTKYRYNLVAAFARLLEEVGKASFRVSGKYDRSYNTRFFNLENAFLFFHARAEYIDGLLQAVNTVFPLDASAEDERKELLEAIHVLIREGNGAPNLFQFIIAIGTLKSRRAVKVQDLLSSAVEGTLVSSEEFDCSGAVQKEIDEQIDKIVVKLEALVEERSGTSTATRLIPLDSNEELDVSLFFGLLGDASHCPDGKTDVRRLAAFAVSRFMEFFGQGLGGGDAGSSHLLPEQALEYEFGKLAYAMSSLERRHEVLTYERFQTIKNGTVAPARYEAESVAVIAEIAGIFRAIGLKIAQHAESARLPQTELDEESASPRAPQVDDASPGDILSKAARTAFATAGFFMNEDVISVIQRQRFVKDEIRVSMRALEQLAIPDEYISIRDHFGLLGY